MCADMLSLNLNQHQSRTFSNCYLEPRCCNLGLEDAKKLCSLLDLLFLSPSRSSLSFFLLWRSSPEAHILGRACCLVLIPQGPMAVSSSALANSPALFLSHCLCPLHFLGQPCAICVQAQTLSFNPLLTDRFKLPRPAQVTYCSYAGQVQTIAVLP